MIILTEETPAVATYLHLRKGSGLSEKTHEAAEIGLAATLYAVLVKKDDMPIGMGRVIGDGGCFCQVVDICVLPDYQGQGIGKQIMQKIDGFLIRLPKTCHVSLLADGAADQLYAKFGFINVLPQSKGMIRKIQGDKNSVLFAVSADVKIC